MAGKVHVIVLIHYKRLLRGGVGVLLCSLPWRRTGAFLYCAPCLLVLPRTGCRMDLKAFLTNLFKADTPDKEEHASQDSGYTMGFEKLGGDAGVIARSGGTTDEDDVDLEHDDSLPNADLDNQDASPRGLRRIFSRILSSVFPSPSDEEELQAYIPHYRTLPILSGIIIPFCILLEIPGLTAHWYIRTDGSTIVASKPNPPLFDVGIALSILCVVLANACLVLRFLETRIMTMTILCIVFLSIHGKLTNTRPTSR